MINFTFRIFYQWKHFFKVGKLTYLKVSKNCIYFDAVTLLLGIYLKLIIYKGGQKKPQNYLLEGGPLVVQASRTR